MEKKFKYKPSAIKYKLLVFSCSLFIRNNYLFSKVLMRTLCLVVISCSLFTAFANDTTKLKSFSLKQAQDFAISNNYQTKNAATDIEKSKKLVAQTTAIGFPQINASVSYQDMIDIPVTLIPGELGGQAAGTFIPLKFGLQHNGSGAITASQLLFDGSYIVGLQAAKTYLDLSKKVLEKSQIEVRESVAQAYYLVLVAEENKLILDSTLAITKKTLDQTKEFLKNGLIEDTDVDQLQLLVSNLENKQNMITRQVEIFYNMLKFQMGIDLKTGIQLTDKLSDIVNSALALNLVSQDFDYKKHIDYRSLKTMESVDILLLKKDKFGYMPSLNCFITTSRNAQRNDFDFFTSNQPWYKTTIFGINLSLPIWDSGIKHFKIQQDKLELQKHGIELTQAQQGLTLAVQNTKSQMKTYSDQYASEIKNMALAKKIYDKTLYKYKEGVSGSLDLTQVQNQYLATQGNYFNTILQLLNSNSNLNKALGN
jgi:outer membrane protein